MKIVWVDVETTGVNHETDSIIELAALYEDTSLNYAEHGDKAKALFHKYCKPDVKPESWDQPLKGRKETISDLTGITWEKLEAEGVSDKELHTGLNNFLLERIVPFDKNDKAIFAAYNAKFDNQMIRALWKRNDDNYFGSYFISATLDVLSTVALAIAKNAMPPLIRHSLDVVCDHLDIPVKSHSAKDDIIATRKVQLELEKLLGINKG